MNIATYYRHSNVILNLHVDKTLVRTRQGRSNDITFITRTQGRRRKMGLCLVKACAATGESEDESREQSKTERRSFLTLAEAGLVEISGLGAHEKFLCRLTISSLNLLRVISEQEGCSIEELNAGKICDWFFKDKLKREQNMESAVLQWDDPDFPF
ncbi:hypothetical protein IGI04_001150 [Brassica rapa subsp. trilocularis]|uniref:Receptor-interacting protein n=2 Tax=Brassica campestris TaxID=3711 RepID=M4DAL7_BRACM|nr:uncharacterized protein LOC103859048 [Brassica rapa]KAG5413583.1 hypothetical protein IGI04_001150 [Brassica rapa subsp. trilocularis]